MEDPEYEKIMKKLFDFNKESKLINQELKSYEFQKEFIIKNPGKIDKLKKHVSDGLQVFFQDKAFQIIESIKDQAESKLLSQ